MKTIFPKMLTYDHICNNLIINQLRKTQHIPSQLLLRHISEAQTVWYCRLMELEYPKDIFEENPDLDITEKKLNANFENYSKFLESTPHDEFYREIQYQNTKGEKFTRKVYDIILHVLNHGTHHRAQISQNLRNLDTIPLPTDYIYINPQLDNN